MEFVIFMAIIVTALLMSQRMLKSQLMGRWKTIADSFGFGRQYEPKKTTVSP